MFATEYRFLYMVAEKSQKSTNASEPNMFGFPATPFVPLKASDSCNIAENWKCWMEHFEECFVLARLQKESPEHQMALLRHALGSEGQRLAKEPYLLPFYVVKEHLTPLLVVTVIPELGPTTAKLLKVSYGRHRNSTGRNILHYCRHQRHTITLHSKCDSHI